MTHWKKKGGDQDYQLSHQQQQQVQLHSQPQELRRPVRSNSLAPPRPPDDISTSHGNEVTEFMESNETEDDSVLERADDFDDDLPIVDIDLRGI